MRVLTVLWTYMIIVLSVYAMGSIFLQVSAHICAENTLMQTKKRTRHSLPIVVEKLTEPLRKMMNTVMKN